VPFTLPESLRARVRHLAQAGFWAACAVVLFGTLSSQAGAIERTFWDKGLHFIAFYGLAVIGAVAFPTLQLRWIGIGLLLFGLGIEGLQKLPFVDRDGSWGDFFADGAGVAFGLVPIALDRLRRALS
jgi:hypothetical protein